MLMSLIIWIYKLSKFNKRKIRLLMKVIRKKGKIIIDKKKIWIKRKMKGRKKKLNKEGLRKFIKG